MARSQQRLVGYASRCVRPLAPKRRRGTAPLSPRSDGRARSGRREVRPDRAWSARGRPIERAAADEAPTSFTREPDKARRWQTSPVSCVAYTRSGVRTSDRVCAQQTAISSLATRPAAVRGDTPSVGPSRHHRSEGRAHPRVGTDPRPIDRIGDATPRSGRWDAIVRRRPGPRGGRPRRSTRARRTGGPRPQRAARPAGRGTRVGPGRHAPARTWKAANTGPRTGPRRAGRNGRAARPAARNPRRGRAATTGTGQRRRTSLGATTRPSDEKIAAWRRMYLEHHKDPDDPQRCAAVGCFGRFPCDRRLEAAELLIVAGVGVPSRE